MSRTFDLPPDLGLDEREIEALFARFEIPLEEAQGLLQETLLTLMLRYPDLRSPQLWVLSTLKRRCVLWCRDRMRRVDWIFDVGFRDALTSASYPEEKRAEMRERLRRWIASVAPGCRETLRRRYGLSEGEVEPPPEIPAEESSELGYVPELIERTKAEIGSKAPGSPSREDLDCVAALIRRIRAETDDSDEDIWVPDLEETAHDEKKAEEGVKEGAEATAEEDREDAEDR